MPTSTTLIESTFEFVKKELAKNEACPDYWYDHTQFEKKMALR